MTEHKQHYPSPDDLLPHAGPMNLLSELVKHNRNETTCRFSLDEQHVFYRDGRVPICYGLEFLGQCAFYHYLLNRHDDGRTGKNGLFLGGRRINVTSPEFDTDTSYIVYARDFGTNDRFYGAKGHIRPEGTDSEPIMEGRLSALLIDEEESLLGDHREQFS